MVNEYKKDPSGFKDTYTDMYFTRLERYLVVPEITEALIFKLVARAKKEDVTLVCFCPNGSFCHRYLAVKWLEHNFNIQYGGERT